MPLKIGKFTAWIEVDGIELPQRGVEYSQNGKNGTCWIASEAEKEFIICWDDAKFSYPNSGVVSLDGIDCGAITTNRKHSTISSLRHFKFARVTPTTQRPFIFSIPELTDDDTYLNHPASPDLGTIKLDIVKVKLTRKRGQTDVLKYTKPGKVHEQSKKALSHRAQLGDEIAYLACEEAETDEEPEEVDHIGTFIFRYRSLAQLQASGIVPRDKGRKRTAPPQDADIVDLTLEDEIADDLAEQRAKDLENELLTLGARTTKVQEELSALQQKQGLRATKRVKMEVKMEVKAEVKAEDLSNGFGTRDIIDLA